MCFIDILKFVNIAVFRFVSFSLLFLNMFESGGHPAVKKYRDLTCFIDILKFVKCSIVRFALFYGGFIDMLHAPVICILQKVYIFIWFYRYVEKREIHDYQICYILLRFS